ncbi:MAG: DNA repair protein RadC [Lachnospiraceae bacterium]|nr:DNA repair protein RadC [Lachnospiraceae bacterium]
MRKTKELPLSERPYEKALKYGTEALSEAELLAIIIRTGTVGSNGIELARSVLELSECKKGILGINYLSVDEMLQIKGIGMVKAIQIKCVAELAKRISQTNCADMIQFTSPGLIAQYYMESMRHLEKEQLVLAMLDTKAKLIKDKVISIGTVNSSFLSPREVFIEALKTHAVNIVLVHNHPSGDPTPSRDDINITTRIFELGKLMDINLIDHIIIGDNTYVSLKEKKII